jgi:hypothetical protein
MTVEDEILSELKEINQILKKNNRPFKNFLNGLMSAVGYLIGTIIITSVLIYFFSQSSFGKEIKSFMQSYKSLNYQLSVPSLGQP